MWCVGTGAHNQQQKRKRVRVRERVREGIDSQKKQKTRWNLLV